MSYIFDNLQQENKRLFKQLILANNCLKFSIEFISFVESIFSKINFCLEVNDILKYKDYVSKYEAMLKGNYIN